MDTLFKKIKPHFDRYKASVDVEFEIRFGKVNNKIFDTNVGRDIFTRISESLEKYTGWENVQVSNTSVYYKDKVRVIVDDDNDSSITMTKTPLLKENLVLQGKPLDVRFAFSKEEPCGEQMDDVMEYVRVKKRKSYIRKNLSIDMTVVSGQSEDPDDEEDQRFEIELEIVNLQKVRDDNELYNIIHKVHNILECL